MLQLSLQHEVRTRPTYQIKDLELVPGTLAFARLCLARLKNPTNLPNQRFGVGARNLGVRFARLKINPLPICEAYFIATATSYSLGILHKSRKGFISLKERHIWMVSNVSFFLVCSQHKWYKTKNVLLKMQMCYSGVWCAIERVDVLFGIFTK